MIRRWRGVPSCQLSVLCAIALGGPGLAWSDEDRTPDSAYSAIASRVKPARGNAVAKPEAESPLPEGSVQNAAQRAPGEGVDEITVVRPRELKPKEPATSGTSLQGADLEDMTARRLDDIGGGAVPNLVLGESADNASAARITLRGVGNGIAGDPDITSNSPIGIAVNGVLQPRAEGTLIDLADAARIDILRGPQDALTAAGGFAGLINITTRRPSFDFGGNAMLRVGNFDLLETNVGVNIPLIPEKVAARLSVTSIDRDGFARNGFVGGGSTVGRSRMIGGRVDLLWNAADDLEMLVSIDRSYSPRSPTARKCTFVGIAPPDPMLVAMGLAGRGAVSLGAVSGAPTRPPRTAEERADIQSRSLANAMTGGEFAAACNLDQDDDRKVFADSPLTDEVVSTRSNLTLTWKPFDSFSLRSTSALNRSVSDRQSDGDATGLPLQGDFRGSNSNGENQSFTQQLVASGDAFSKKLRWNLGLSAILENNKSDSRTRAFPGTENQPAFIAAQGTNAEDNARIDATLAGDPALRDAGLAALLRANPEFTRRTVTGPALTSGLGECVRFDGDTPTMLAATCLRPFQPPFTESALSSGGRTYALFGDFNLQVTKKLRLGAGFRWQMERRRIKRFANTDDVEAFSQRTDPTTQLFGLDGDPNNGGRFISATLLNLTKGVTTDFGGADRFSSFRPRLSFDYGLTGTSTLFGSYSMSARPGALNGRGIGGTVQFGDPEFLTQLEVGYRSSWFRRRLSMEASVFQTLQRDLQRTALLGGQPANGVTRGGELEFTALPLRGLLLTSSLGFTTAYYSDVDRMKPTGTAPARSLEDIDRFPSTPTYTMNYSATYTLPVGPLGSLRTRLAWRYEGSKAGDTLDNPSTRIAKIGMLSGRMALELPDGATTIALFGNNLFDREAPTITLDLTGANGSLQQIFTQPRTYGLELQRRF